MRAMRKITYGPREVWSVLVVLFVDVFGDDVMASPCARML